MFNPQENTYDVAQAKGCASALNDNTLRLQRPPSITFQAPLFTAELSSHAATADRSQQTHNVCENVSSTVEQRVFGSGDDPQSRTRITDSTHTGSDVIYVSGLIQPELPAKEIHV